MSNGPIKPLRAVLVGCGGMGKHQARILAEHADYALTAVCDVDKEAARTVAEAAGVASYADFGEALAQERPDIVAICTSSASHAELTIQAAAAGVRGVYCEKPMACNLAEARAMVDACEERSIPLVVNHQRRLGPDLVEARRLMESGAIGTVRCIRAHCAGDLLSDGTHMLDSVLWLTGDRSIKWAFGQMQRDIEAVKAGAAKRGQTVSEPGYRFGHPVETGGIALLENADGVRINLFWGDMREEGRVYQDYEVVGSRGNLWRTGDQHSPNLFIQDAEGGTWDAGIDGYVYKPIPNPDEAAGLWRPAELAEGGNLIAEGYRLFAETVRKGADHPMCAQNALRSFEVLVAIGESARLHRNVALPVEQDRLPLEIMMEQGQI